MSEPRRIQAVTFDVGGTLIEPWPSVGQVYADVARSHGVKTISADELNVRFKTIWRASHGFDYTRAGWEELVNQTFRGLLPDCERVGFFPELYERFAEAAAWRVFEDVLPTLDALAPLGIRLGVISNWDERLRPLLRKLGLQDRFESLIVSCEAGYPKPASLIFARAAAAFELPATAILHVGDSFEMDVEGARSAGFRALHLRRDRAETGVDEMRSLAELPAWITNRISPL